MKTLNTIETERRPRLWTRNFTTINIATALGAIGGIAGGYAMAFLVYEETQSTFLAALLVAVRVVPGLLVPMLISPIMDRLPRKPFLVGGDAVAAVVYLTVGLWLRYNEFNYPTYLIFTLVLSCVWSVDELSYNSLFPKLIPKGLEEKGYAAASLLYPILTVVVMPLAAVMYRTVGAANILIFQAGFSLAAVITESTIKIKEEITPGTRFSLRQWTGDIKAAAAYLRREKGLLAMTVYSSTGGGMYAGQETVMIGFFSSAAGFSPELYAVFSAAEVVGRSIGGVIAYKKQIRKEKKYDFALGVYVVYDSMDASVLWLPYPLMLVNRAICGFLGAQSSVMRYAATQKYIPESMRARINAFQSIVFTAFEAVLTVAVGALGDVMDHRLVMTVCGVFCLAVCFATIVRRRKWVRKIYESESGESAADGKETAPADSEGEELSCNESLTPDNE